MEAGVGLPNVFSYWGGTMSPMAPALTAGLVSAGLLVLVAKGRLDSTAGAVVASISGAFLSGETAALGLPLALLALGGLGAGDGEGIPR